MERYKNMIISLICIFILMSPTIKLSAQLNVDSLETALKTAGNEGKTSILNTLSAYYLSESPGKAIEYGSKAIIIAEEQKNNNGKITALINVGEAYLNLGDHSQSFNYYKQALNIAKSISSLKDIARVSLKIANYYNMKSVYDESLKYSLEALKIYKISDDSAGLSATYHHIGIVYYYLGNLEKALEFTQNALAIRETTKDKSGISKSTNNIAMIYMNMNNNEKALEYYNKALTLMEQLKSISDQAITLSNIAITYNQLNQNEKAVAYYHKSLAMFDNFTDNRNKARILACLGATYTDMKKYDKAQSYLEQGLSIAKKSDYLDMIALNYRYLADLYLMMGDYKKTLDYKNLLTDIKDSVFNEASQKSIAELQTKIENDNTQREASLIKEKSNLISLLFILLILSILIIAVVLIRRYRTKIQEKIMLRNQNIIMNEVNLTIENLLFWSNYQKGTYQLTPSEINLSDEIEKNIEQISQDANTKKLNIISSVDEDIKVKIDKNALSFVLRHFLMNAVKHSSDADIVKISSSVNGNMTEFEFTYSSPGIDIEEISNLFSKDIHQIVDNKEKYSGEKIGMVLCKEYIEKSGGKIGIRTIDNRRISINFTLRMPEKLGKINESPIIKEIKIINQNILEQVK
ncbi:MAG: tetratricopeptide repeat-containing sensor histidine kinase [Candidatus Woesearchaeota archaeon]